MRFINKNFLISYLNKEYRHYAVYINLSYWWNFGALSFVMLAVQIVTGIFLAMNYIPSFDLAFLSCEHIMRDVNFGWLIRYIHANGASFFFLLVYCHIGRGLYFGSYIKPKDIVWVIGVAIFLLMIITAFLGYVLPWGQMSFWAATVITNLFTAVPVFGQEIVVWLWGGYSVDHATLNRFFSLHYLLPFIIVFCVLLHVIFLHDKGSSNPLGLFLLKDKVMFNPYYTIKDLYTVIVLFIFFLIFVSFAPNYLGHSDNYIMANPLVTPAHIVPEWYFLPFYAILRSIPDKLGGILVLLCAILVLFFLPYFSVNLVKHNSFRFFYKLFFYFFMITVIFLGYLGGNPVEDPYLFLGQFFTLSYFVYFLFLLNILVWFDWYSLDISGRGFFKQFILFIRKLLYFSK